MNPEAYLGMSETESTHWWFIGRRTVIFEVIKGLGLPKNADILEIGCGTGGNLDMLAQFGGVSAIEMNSVAREIAFQKTGGRYEVRLGHCPDGMPLFSKRFDLICMFDVLEHIEQDIETLNKLKALLKKNGRILITVPAYQWLYGPHDEFLHHKRRYSAVHLRDVVASAGLHSVKTSYFNTLLFPFAVIVRIKDRIYKKASNLNADTPNKMINSLLRIIFELERLIINRTNFPFGVSLLSVIESSNEI